MDELLGELSRSDPMSDERRRHRRPYSDLCVRWVG